MYEHFSQGIFLSSSDVGLVTLGNTIEGNAGLQHLTKKIATIGLCLNFAQIFTKNRFIYLFIFKFH